MFLKCLEIPRAGSFATPADLPVGMDGGLDVETLTPRTLPPSAQNIWQRPDCGRVYNCSESFYTLKEMIVPLYCT